MDAKAIKRLQQLVRLAVDSGASEAEARSAAIIACRMLMQHDVLATLVESPARAPKAPPKAPDPWDDYDQSHNSDDYVQDAYNEEDSFESEPEAPPHEAPAREARAREESKGKDPRRKWRSWLRIDSKFTGRCYWCSGWYVKGDDILWDPSTRSCVCPECREQLEKDRREGRVR